MRVYLPLKRLDWAVAIGRYVKLHIMVGSGAPLSVLRLIAHRTLSPAPADRVRSQQAKARAE